MAESPREKTEFIGNLLRPHWATLSWAFLAAMGEAAANLAEPWPIKLVLDSVLRGKPLRGTLAKFTSWLAAALHAQQHAILLLAVTATLVIAIAGAFFSYSEKLLTTTVGQWVMHDLRSKLYSRMQQLSLSYHDQAQTGDLISRVTSDVDAIQTFVTSGLLSALINTLTLAGMVGVMFYMDWRFTLIALSVAPLLFAVVFHYTRRIKNASREVRKKEGQIVSIIQEALSSIRVVKAFSREDYEQQRMEEQSLESVETALLARSLKAKLSPLVDVIVAVGTSLVLWYGALRVLRGTLLVGSLVVFILYLGKMYKPMQELSKMTDVFSKASVGYERICEVLDRQSDVRDRPGAKKAPRFRGEVEFKDVNFEYEPGHPVLKDFSLTIPAGKVLAFVGPTGAGKSSIAGLICRFYDPISGTVSIDGKDIRSFTQKSLREQVSFVLQTTVLFHGPIWQNIAYGKPQATRAEIIEAARIANAQEFIDKMPQGYDTMVGERGVTLSGGQAQRIAIARAVIRNTPLLILDEPTSGLDAASEQLVVEALDRLMQNRTTIIIAHRLSTIRGAHMICVIQDGQLVEQGTHDELVQAGGIYAGLCKLQMAEA
jgi:subfamily B ATP-binding cassette protein MsbA